MLGVELSQLIIFSISNFDKIFIFLKIIFFINFFEFIKFEVSSSIHLARGELYMAWLDNRM